MVRQNRRYAHMLAELLSNQLYLSHLTEDSSIPVHTLYITCTLTAFVGAEHSVATNAICLIKEPYFKVMNDGDYGLRVDHVSDFIWLGYDNERIPSQWQPRLTTIQTASTLKEEGNAAIKAGLASKAAALYSPSSLVISEIFTARQVHLGAQTIKEGGRLSCHSPEPVACILETRSL